MCGQHTEHSASHGTLCASTGVLAGGIEPGRGKDMAGQGPTRWELLFADLEGQLAAQEQAARDGEVAELTRAEQASIAIVDRLRAGIGAGAVLELADGEALRGVVRRVATTWLLLDGQGASGNGSHLVPLGAIAGITGLARHAVPSTTRLDNLGLGTVLRELQRDRARVVVRTAAGQVAGRLARVGQDHLDLEETDRAPVTVRTVPFAALRRVSQS